MDRQADGIEVFRGRGRCARCPSKASENQTRAHSPSNLKRRAQDVQRTESGLQRCHIELKQPGVSTVKFKRETKDFKVVPGRGTQVRAGLRHDNCALGRAASKPQYRAKEITARHPVSRRNAKRCQSKGRTRVRADSLVAGLAKEFATSPPSREAL